MVRAARDDGGIRERRVTVDRVHTRVLDVDGRGPAIGLLHGFTDSADSWRPALEALARMRRRAAAVDLPGFGAAGPLERGAVLEPLGRFTRAFARELGDGAPIVLAGNSMGGVIALRAAAGRWPEVGAIAPVAPAGFGFTPRFEAIDRVMGALVPVLRITYRLPLPAWLVRAAATQLYELRLSMGRADPALARMYGSHFRGGTDLRRIGAIARRLSVELRDDAVFELDRVAVPTLVLWGEEDAVCDVRGAEALRDGVPGARLRVLPGCGHVPQIQRPDEVARAIAGLLDG